jgi:hypothetical protein
MIDWAAMAFESAARSIRNNLIRRCWGSDRLPHFRYRQPPLNSLALFSFFSKTAPILMLFYLQTR